jgi:hypothetical protein
MCSGMYADGMATSPKLKDAGSTWGHVLTYGVSEHQPSELEFGDGKSTQGLGR